MNTINVLDKCFRLYITEEEIQTGVKKCARMLNDKFSGASKPPLIISLLNGAAFFTVDLVKQLNFLSSVDFVKYSSYKGIIRTDEFRSLIGMKNSVEGEDVIIIDDILDSGVTMKNVIEILKQSSPKSITTVVCIYKPKSIITDIKVDCWAIEMQDNPFVIGYGLDYNEVGRTLKDIYILD